MSIFSEMNMMCNDIFNMIHFVSMPIYKAYQLSFEVIGEELMDIIDEDEVQVDDIYANDYNTLEQVYSTCSHWMNWMDNKCGKWLGELGLVSLYFALDDMVQAIIEEWEEEC